MNNLKILVVDDDPVTRLMLKKTLSKFECKVDTVEDGIKAVERLSSHYYDVVLTDLMMPGGIDGIGVLDAVKEKYNNTEVILITGFASVDTAITAMKKGAADYLQKPINIDEVILRLKRVARLKSLAKDAGDLREAMDITERNAGETIQTLELAVSELEHKLTNIKDLLTERERGEDADSIVDSALRILT